MLVREPGETYARVKITPHLTVAHSINRPNKLAIYADDEIEKMAVLECDAEIISVHPYNDHLFIFVDTLGKIYRVNIESEIPVVKINFEIINTVEIPAYAQTITHVSHASSSPYIIFGFDRKLTTESKGEGEYLHVYDVSCNKFYGLHFKGNDRIFDLCVIPPGYIGIIWDNLSFNIYRFDREQVNLKQIFTIPKVEKCLISPCTNFCATLHSSGYKLWSLRDGSFKMLSDIQVDRTRMWYPGIITITPPIHPNFINGHFTRDGCFIYPNLSKIKDKPNEYKSELIEIDLKTLFSVPYFIYGGKTEEERKDFINKGKTRVERQVLQSKHSWDVLLANWFHNLLLEMFKSPLPRISADVLDIVKEYTPVLVFDVFHAFPEEARCVLMSQLETLSQQGMSAEPHIKDLIEFALLYACGNPVSECISSVKNPRGPLVLFPGKKELPKCLSVTFDKIEKIVNEHKKSSHARALPAPALAPAAGERKLPAPAGGGGAAAGERKETAPGMRH